jgi:hypothetical protein
MKKTNNFKKIFLRQEQHFYYNAPQGLTSNLFQQGKFDRQACQIHLTGADWMRRFDFLFHNNYNLKNGKNQDIFLKKWGKKIWK